MRRKLVHAIASGCGGIVDPAQVGDPLILTPETGVMSVKRKLSDVSRQILSGQTQIPGRVMNNEARSSSDPPTEAMQLGGIVTSRNATF